MRFRDYVIFLAGISTLIIVSVGTANAGKETHSVTVKNSCRYPDWGDKPQYAYWVRIIAYRHDIAVGSCDKKDIGPGQSATLSCKGKKGIILALDKIGDSSGSLSRKKMKYDKPELGEGKRFKGLNNEYVLSWKECCEDAHVWDVNWCD